MDCGFVSTSFKFLQHVSVKAFIWTAYLNSLSGEKMINCLPLPSLKTIIDFKRIHKLLLIPVIALIGDAIVNHYTFPLWPLLLKCCADSSTHFMVAALSWSYVANISIVNNRNHTATILLSGLLASLIDVDHFIASGAMTLQVKIK